MSHCPSNGAVVSTAPDLNTAFATIVTEVAMSTINTHSLPESVRAEIALQTTPDAFGLEPLALVEGDNPLAHTAPEPLADTAPNDVAEVAQQAPVAEVAQTFEKNDVTDVTASRPNDHGPRTCAQCGAGFHPPKAAPDAVLCRDCYQDRKRKLDGLAETARGHWHGILTHFGIDPAYLRNQHGPCPGCGGSNRFRYDDKDGRGTWVCGQGGGMIAGDGFQLLEHVHGWDPKTGFLKVASYFGIADLADIPPPDPALIQQREQDAARRAADEHAEQQQTAERAAKIWDAAAPITDDAPNPYLARKGVTVSENLRQMALEALVPILGYRPKSDAGALSGVLLVVPYRRDGELTTVQLIDEPGRKAFLKGKGTQVRAFWEPPIPDGVDPIVVAEGVATALSLTQCSGYPAVAAGSVGNIAKTVSGLHKAYPKRRVVIAADLEKGTDTPIRAALEAAAKFRPPVPVIYPDTGPLGLEGVTDFNDLHQAVGPDEVRAQVTRFEAVTNATSDSQDRKGSEHSDSVKKSEAEFYTSETSDPSAARVSSRFNTSAIPPEIPPETSAIPPETSFFGCLLYENDKGETKTLIDSKAADAVAKHLTGKLARDAEAGAWSTWAKTHWQPQTTSAKAEKLIADAVHEGCGSLGYRVAYLNGITTILTRRNLLEAPDLPTGVVPFQNGLLDLKTLALKPATPNYALDWCLPWHWDPQADCPNIKAWLKRSVNGQDEETVQLLRAWLAALLRGLDLQYFLTLIGRGGSGKGTFQRLAAALVGINNVAVTDLARLEKNQFETAKLYGKRLCMINEAGKYGGSVDVLKSITGGDHIPLERKGIQQNGSFRFRGLVLMATNEPIIATDSTSGLERRRITVRFPYSATAAEKAHWDALGGEKAVLHAEIPGLIRWLLDMPVREIKARLSQLPQSVAHENLLGMSAGNSVAEWLVENTIPVARDTRGAQVGVKTSSADHCLYPHYLRWCDETGRNHPVSIRKFSDTVLDITEHLGVKTRKDRGGETRAACLFGIRLRNHVEEPHNWIAKTEVSGGMPEVSGGIGGGMPEVSNRPASRTAVDSEVSEVSLVQPAIINCAAPASATPPPESSTTPAPAKSVQAPAVGYVPKPRFDAPMSEHYRWLDAACITDPEERADYLEAVNLTRAASAAIVTKATVTSDSEKVTVRV